MLVVVTGNCVCSEKGYPISFIYMARKRVKGILLLEVNLTGICLSYSTEIRNAPVWYCPIVKALKILRILFYNHRSEEFWILCTSLLFIGNKVICT